MSIRVQSVSRPGGSAADFADASTGGQSWRGSQRMCQLGSDATREAAEIDARARSDARPDPRRPGAPRRGTSSRLHAESISGTTERRSCRIRANSTACKRSSGVLAPRGVTDLRAGPGSSHAENRRTAGGWCPGRDLNPDELPHTPLKRTRIPIPPPGQVHRARRDRSGGVRWYRGRDMNPYALAGTSS